MQVRYFRYILVGQPSVANWRRQLARTSYAYRRVSQPPGTNVEDSC